MRSRSGSAAAPLSARPQGPPCNKCDGDHTTSACPYYPDKVVVAGPTMSSLFEGTMVDYLRCTGCGKRRDREVKFTDVSLTLTNLEAHAAAAGAAPVKECPVAPAPKAKDEAKKEEAKDASPEQPEQPNDQQAPARPGTP